MKNVKFFKIAAYVFVLASLCMFIVYNEYNNQSAVSVVDKKGYDESPFGGDFILRKVVRDKMSIQTVPFHLNELRGRFVILYFGYTYCPDVCPLGLSNISQSIQAMGRNRDEFVPVFITVDPERDTNETLMLYASNFDPSFIFLTGLPAEIETVKKQYRVYAEKNKASLSQAKDAYLVDHSSYIYILDRSGKFIKNIPHDMQAQDMTKEFVSVLLKHKK